MLKCKNRDFVKGADALIRRVTCVACWYVGGERSHGIEGGLRAGIQFGI